MSHACGNYICAQMGCQGLCTAAPARMCPDPASQYGAPDLNLRSRDALTKALNRLCDLIESQGLGEILSHLTSEQGRVIEP